MIRISEEAFEKLLTRAFVVGEEHFRRMVFDHDGMNPKAIEVIHDGFVEGIAKRYVEAVVRRAEAWAEKRDKRAARKNRPRA